MGRLDQEARMAIRTLESRGASKSEIARLLGVTEGAIRYHAARMAAGSIDGRARQVFKADRFIDAIDWWREQQGEDAVNLAALHGWLRSEHDYDGSLRSVQRYWKQRYPAPAIRARRRVETPPGAQVQVDWAHFPGVIVDGRSEDLLAFHMVLSWSRKEAIVWSRAKDQLSWLSCHTAAFERLGGVTATVRVDNEKTAVAHGAGAWGTINRTYRRYGAELRFHIDPCPPRQPWTKGKVERKVRDQRMALDPHGQAWSDLEDLQRWSDEQLEVLSRERRCPATGTTVAEAWGRERTYLTPLPETRPEPFDAVATRVVGLDGLVAFEGRQYSVPFRFVGEAVEIRGCAGVVRAIKACEEIACHPRGTAARVLITPSHYDGPSTDRVKAPPPLGRMGAKLQELADLKVAHRAIDLYAALAEVAR
jgi:transposase